MTFLIERDAGARLVLALAQGAHGHEARDGQRRDGRFAAACQHDVLIAVPDLMERFADRVAGSGACRYRGRAVPFAAPVDGDRAGCQIDECHRDEERRDTARPSALHVFLCRLDRLDAADARTDQHAEALHILFFRIQPAVCHRLLGRDARKLGETVIELQLALAEVLLHIQILHLCRELDLILSGVKMRDRIDAALVFPDALPQLGSGVADG